MGVREQNELIGSVPKKTKAIVVLPPNARDDGARLFAAVEKLAGSPAVGSASVTVDASFWAMRGDSPSDIHNIVKGATRVATLAVAFMLTGSNVTVVIESDTPYQQDATGAAIPIGAHQRRANELIEDSLRQIQLPEGDGYGRLEVVRAIGIPAEAECGAIVARDGGFACTGDNDGIYAKIGTFPVHEWPPRMRPRVVVINRDRVLDHFHVGISAFAFARALCPVSFRADGFVNIVRTVYGEGQRKRLISTNPPLPALRPIVDAFAHLQARDDPQGPFWREFQRRIAGGAVVEEFDTRPAGSNLRLARECRLLNLLLEVIAGLPAAEQLDLWRRAEREHTLAQRQV